MSFSSICVEGFARPTRQAGAAAQGSRSETESQPQQVKGITAGPVEMGQQVQQPQG